jgi:hypothetical protein
MLKHCEHIRRVKKKKKEVSGHTVSFFFFERTFFLPNFFAFSDNNPNFSRITSYCRLAGVTFSYIFPPYIFAIISLLARSLLYHVFLVFLLFSSRCRVSASEISFRCENRIFKCTYTVLTA